MAIAKKHYTTIGIVIIAAALIIYLFWNDIKALLAAPSGDTGESANSSESNIYSLPAATAWAVNDNVFINGSTVNIRTGAGTNFDSIGTFDTGYFAGTYRTVKNLNWIEFTPVPELSQFGSPLYVSRDYATNNGDTAESGVIDNILDFFGYE